jgi:hypothetical protein
MLPDQKLFERKWGGTVGLFLKLGAIVFAFHDKKNLSEKFIVKSLER